jgi:hypothetical protein
VSHRPPTSGRFARPTDTCRYGDQSVTIPSQAELASVLVAAEFVVMSVLVLVLVGSRLQSSVAESPRAKVSMT